MSSLRTRATGAITPTVPMIPEAQLAPYTYEPNSPTYGSNIASAWSYATGLGVGVAVIDDGFTPGLLTNFNASASQSLGSPGLQEPSGGYHGTTTSTEIGGSGAGGGPVGIAPNATMSLFKVDMGNAPFSEFVNALNAAAASSAVVNNSWGFTGFGVGSASNPQFAPWYTALQTAVAKDRGGLGDAIVFAAGNDRADGNDIGLQPLQDDPRVIAVAATNQNGTVASFSNPGAGLLVSALGVNVAVSLPSGQSAYGAGTSYAAPIVSGVVAMMLQVNPNLGWRDIQEILADSAYEPAPSASSFVTNAAKDWNGGGMHFSDDLGFGIVDANVAVNLARTWTEQSTSANMDSVAVKQTKAFAVPVDGTANSTVTEKQALRVQHVTVHLDDENLPAADTRLVLVSPSGTQSVLLNDAGNVGGQDLTGGLDLSGSTIESNAFWGEKAAGTWTLEVQDSNGSVVGTVNDWTLTIDGDSGTGQAPLVYTPEFWQLASSGSTRTLVSNAGLGTTTIDLIALPNPTKINLNGGPGMIDSVPVTVSSGLRNVNLDGSTGAATVTAASAGGKITGGDGPTSIYGAGGTDTITASAGATTVWADNDTRTIFYGGTGKDIVYGGAGETDIHVGAGADELVVTKTLVGGLDVITGFQVGTDSIDLVGYGSNAATAALGSEKSDSHGGTLLTLSDGTRIDLVDLMKPAESVFV